MSDFNGKVVIVTGAAGGIGAAAAIQFARQGARVTVADIDEIGIRQTAVLIGERALAVQVDVADPSSCAAMVAKTVAEFGRLDVIFNNAGVSGSRHNTASQPLDEWQRVIDINLSGVFYCTKYAIPEMQKVGGGVIVNTASVDGHVGMATISPYTASKHGVLGLTKCVALEYGRENIRCVAICPGFIDTAMTRQSLSEDEAGAMAQSIPNVGGQAAQPEQVANLALWLASDKASYVNGSSHVVDAGLMAGFSLPEPVDEKVTPGAAMAPGVRVPHHT
jgi:NAD(P)-dependent dehydrogenase (short-subunit alcohol dehydrogenase family)